MVVAADDDFRRWCREACCVGEGGCDAGARSVFAGRGADVSDGVDAAEFSAVAVVGKFGISGPAAFEEAVSGAETSADAAVAAAATAAAAAAAAAAAPDPEGLKMIFLTPVVDPVPPSFFLALGNEPSGAMFSKTPNRLKPASSKLALLCTGGSSHLFIKARSPSLFEPRFAPEPFSPFPFRC